MLAGRVGILRSAHLPKLMEVEVAAMGKGLLLRVLAAAAVARGRRG